MAGGRPGGPDELALRVAGDDDMELLFVLLREALGPYVEQTFGSWDEEEQRARFFAATDPATHEVVEWQGRAIGCLFVRREPDEIRINRIFLFPAEQNRGIGTHLVHGILAEAKQAGLPVRLRVLEVNPARRFYERLGFRVSGETETHTLMEWTDRGGG